MSSPLYLTDVERPLRNAHTRNRYRLFLTFRLRQTIYTRWFKSPEDRASYINTLEKAEQLQEGEERTDAR